MACILTLALTFGVGAEQKGNCGLLFQTIVAKDLGMGINLDAPKKSMRLSIWEGGAKSRSVFGKMSRLLWGRALKTRELAKVAERFRGGDPEQNYFQRISEAFGYHVEIAAKSEEEIRQKIPSSGPLILIANYQNSSTGIPVAATLGRFRPDLKIFVPRVLEDFPGIKDHAFFIDERSPSRSLEARSFNRRQRKAFAKYVAGGGAVVIFPFRGEALGRRGAGTVFKNGNKLTPEWKTRVAEILEEHPETRILSVYVDSAPKMSAPRARKIFDKLRAQPLTDFFTPIFKVRELAHNINNSFRLVLGSPYSGKELAELFSGRMAQMLEYVRAETLLLGGRLEKPSPVQEYEQIINPVSVEALRADYKRMTPLVSSHGIDVLIGRGEIIPSVVRELGRIRETIFRTVNEGTGKSHDNDEFDKYYLHLIAVDTDSGAILGAYRMGLVDEILREANETRFLYNTTLFEFDNLLRTEFRNGIELGRSIVNPAGGAKYRRALDMIWKGIAAFIERNPHYTHLIGPVSMSNSYSDVSKLLLVEYFFKYHKSPLADQVRPKLGVPISTDQRDEVNQVLDIITDVKQLHRLIKDIDGVGVPLLFISYGKMGAQYLAFNYDPLFNSLDGMIVVDLRRAPRKELEKYFTPEALDQYRAYHGVEEVQ